MWHGVRVPREIIESPETLTVERILGEQNTEVRRVMIEKVGLEKFFSDANATEIHHDVDGCGNPRWLLRITLPNDEALVAIHLTDPSTGRKYLLRVPPDISNCQEAVAWTFGLETNQYAPNIEQ
jgi:hypothetical protein